MSSSRRHVISLILFAVLLLPSRANALSQPLSHRMPGCTTFFAYDGQTALGGNNEDFNNPLTLIWFIPPSPGRFGRVYFGYDDYLPQGGLNDQGVFFDGLALPYKEMPLTSQRPHFPGGDLALMDEILSRSANVQDVTGIASRWNRLGGEFAQFLYGDRFGDSVIIDGDTILNKQGAFQVATNFRLVDQPDPSYPKGEERYRIVYDMLSRADYYSVELFRKALEVAHAEGDYPTLYSQVYELNTGKIHLYQYHDFEHEVVLVLADELAKGPHVVTISSLFPRNDDLEQWAVQQEARWKANYQKLINPSIQPDSLGWMSGGYLLGEAAGPVRVYLENDQLFLQRPDQLPIELYPKTADTVFHHFFNGMDLTLTFERNLWGQATGAQGTFSFDPYEIAVPYNLSRPGIASFKASALITMVSVGIALILLGSVLVVFRRRRSLEARNARQGL
jgi:hypothetical protein